MSSKVTKGKNWKAGGARLEAVKSRRGRMAARGRTAMAGFVPF